MSDHASQALLPYGKPSLTLRDYTVIIILSLIILAVFVALILSGLMIPQARCHGDYVCLVNCNVGLKVEDGYLLYDCTFISPIDITLITRRDEPYDKRIDVYVRKDDKCACPDENNVEQYTDKQVAYTEPVKESNTIITVLVLESFLCVVVLASLIGFILTRLRR